MNYAARRTWLPYINHRMELAIYNTMGCRNLAALLVGHHFRHLSFRRDFVYLYFRVQALPVSVPSMELQNLIAADFSVCEPTVAAVRFVIIDMMSALCFENLGRPFVDLVVARSPHACVCTVIESLSVKTFCQ